MNRLAVALAVFLALLAMPCVASAEKGHAPPGNSGIDEYVESIPTAKGNRPTGKLRPGRTSLLSAQARGKLRAAGADGRRVEALVRKTAPRRRARSTTSQGDSPGEFASLGEALSGSNQGGMGVALPIILALTLLVLGSVFLIRRLRTE
jgi:hypothetical protein